MKATDFKMISGDTIDLSIDDDPDHGYLVMLEVNRRPYDPDIGSVDIAGMTAAEARKLASTLLEFADDLDKVREEAGEPVL